MEIKLNEIEILELTQFAGTIAGIADSMANGFIPDTRTQKLRKVSDQIIELLKRKVNQGKPISSEIADQYFKK